MGKSTIDIARLSKGSLLWVEHGVGSLNAILTDVQLVLGNVMQDKRRHVAGT